MQDRSLTAGRAHIIYGVNKGINKPLTSAFCENRWRRRARLLLTGAEGGCFLRVTCRTGRSGAGAAVGWRGAPVAPHMEGLDMSYFTMSRPGPLRRGRARRLAVAALLALPATLIALPLPPAAAASESVNIWL